MNKPQFELELKTDILLESFSKDYISKNYKLYKQREAQILFQRKKLLIIWIKKSKEIITLYEIYLSQKPPGCVDEYINFSKNNPEKYLVDEGMLGWCRGLIKNGKYYTPDANFYVDFDEIDRKINKEN